MADSLFAKIRLGTLARLHNMADAYVDMDSPAAIKQSIRDLESGLEEVQGAGDEANGNVRNLTRQKNDLTAKMAQQQSNIDLLLGDDDPGNDHLAIAMQVALLEMGKNLTVISDQLVDGQNLASQLSDAAAKIETKHQQMLAGLQRIEMLASSTSGKEKAADALAKAGSLADGLDSASVDDVAARLQRRADTADARFDRAMTSVSSSTEDQTAIALATVALANRKKQLDAAKAGAQSVETAPATS